MTNIAAFIKAMMYKDRIEEEERKSSFLDKILNSKRDLMNTNKNEKSFKKK